MAGYGLSTIVQEFSCSRTGTLIRALSYLLGAVAGLLFFFRPGLHLVSVAAALLGAILLALILKERPPFAGLLGKGLSQNVIGQYIPDEPTGARRKIVIMAHYDSERSMIQGSPPLADYYILLRLVIRIAIFAMPVLMLLGFAPLPGVFAQIRSILTLLLGVVAALVFAMEALNAFQPFNDGANSNASGVAALFGVIERITGRQAQAHPVRNDDARAERDGARPRFDVRARASEGPPQADLTADGAQGQGRQLRRGGAGTVFARGEAGRNDAARSEAGYNEAGRSEPAGGGASNYGERPGGSSRVRPRGAGAQAGMPLAAARQTARRASSAGETSFAALASRAAMLSAAGARKELEATTGGDSQAQGREGVDAPTRQAAFDTGTGTHQGLPATVAVIDGTGGAGGMGTGGVGAGGAGGMSGTGAGGMGDTSLPAARLDGTAPIAMVRADAEGPGEPSGDAQSGHAERRQARQQPEPTAAVPAWYANAKKKAAEKEARESTGAGGDKASHRSQFADVPLGVNAAKPNTLNEDGSYIDAPAGAPEGASAPFAEAGEGAGMTLGGGASASGASDGGASDGGRDTYGASASDGGFRAVYGREAATGDAHGAATPTSPEDAQAAWQQAQQAAQPLSQPHGQPLGQQSQQDAQQRFVNPQTDMSGLDTTAFKVLRDERGALVVPGQDYKASHGAAPSIRQPAQHDSMRRTAGPARRNLNIPSLAPGDSGAIPAQQAAFDEQYVPDDDYGQQSDSLINATGSFAAFGATGTMKPVGEELLLYNEPEDIYIDDADDSHVVDTDMARPYAMDAHRVDIPASRAHSLFGSIGDRLSGKKRQERLEDSASSWLGVDDDFDARREGGAIGSWQNFSAEDEDTWKGGGYGGFSHEENIEAMMMLSSELLNKELWFVALGAKGAGSAGVKALFNEYGNELKNALFINVEAVGAGDLCFTVREGTFRPTNTDHRLQSLVQSSAGAIGVEVAPVSFTSYRTDATEALKQGGRAISIIGLGKDLPVAWNWSDDRADILSEDGIQSAADLLTEMIKSI
jgi:hypothetical protein